MSGKPTKKRKLVLQSAQEAPRYEFADLVANDKELQHYATILSDGKVQLDLSLREATYALTRAILRKHFDLRLTLPPGQLVPTIPNRVQYLRWAAQLLGKPAQEEGITAVDIGTGPSCIYALLGTRLFPKWTFAATDTDPIAIHSARRNVETNKLGKIKILHTSPDGQLLPPEVVALKPSLTVCNPPFHEELPNTVAPAGSKSQLVTQGGEFAFLCRLADESTQVATVDWFTSLVGRKVDLPKIITYLRSPRIQALYVKPVELSTGGRTVRWAVAWSFGEDRSKIRLLDDHGSKWRHIFSVRPGRQFANQLCGDDITATFSSILTDWKWREENESSTIDNKSDCSVVLKGPEKSPMLGTALLLNVMEGADPGEFLAHLKVRDRGGMNIEHFRDLGDQLLQSLSDLLNEH